MSKLPEMLRECHATVRKYRTELEPYWPTPTREDALLFALTELGESIDADLRTNGTYARNRDKDLSVLDELADMSMMLLTAMGPELHITELAAGALSHTWPEYVGSMSGVMQMSPGTAWADYNLTQLLARIATHPGMDLPVRLTARLERIKAKRLPPPTISVVDAYEQRKVAHESEAA